jgi:hypothetical protein
MPLPTGAAQLDGHATSKCVTRIAASKCVTRIAALPDSEPVVTAGTDTKLRVFAAASGELQHTLVAA